MSACLPVLCQCLMTQLLTVQLCFRPVHLVTVIYCCTLWHIYYISMLQYVEGRMQNILFVVDDILRKLKQTSYTMHFPFLFSVLNVVLQFLNK